MANEKTLDFNEGAEQSPSGAGQPGKNASEPGKSAEDLEKEIDATLSKGADDIEVEIDDDDEDDTVVLKKKDIKKILEIKDQYKNGLKSAKEKLKGFKQNPEKPAPAAAPAAPAADDATKRILKGIERDAIATACEDPIVEKYWDKLLPHIDPRVDRSSGRAIAKGINNAKVLMLAENPDIAAEEAKLNESDEDNEATARLSRHNGIQSGSGKQGNQNPAKKSILPKKTPVQEWYGKPKK